MKAMNTKFLILLLMFFLEYVTGQSLKNHVIVDNIGTYHVFWSVDDENITIEVQVATKGYVGFGLSPNGGMTGSDIVIGWVLPSGQAYFHDRHALGFYEPVIDNEQNYFLLKAFENETNTVLRFTRKLNTCDRENDTAITDDTMKVIYSWHPDDPSNTSGLLYHGPDHRGTKDIQFITPKSPPVQVTDDVTIWDIQMPNITLPAEQTTYWCTIVKLPQLTVPHYYIGYNVYVTPGNENVVHHIALTTCLGNTTYSLEAHNEGNMCETSTVPDIEDIDCSPTMIIWETGFLGQTLPEGVGIPMGYEYGGPSYFMLQVHYNNTEMKSGIVDSSTLRLYLSNKYMPKKAAMLNMRANIDYSFVIPPQQPAFKVAIYCPSDCTANVFPEEGINVYAVGFQAYLAGRKLLVRHYRGNNELMPIAKNDNYDFHHQAVWQLPEPVTILPGDMLMGTCVYSSMDQNETIVGGYSTAEEMCAFHFYYYPAIHLTYCYGGPNYQDIFDYFGVESVAEDKIRIIAPASLQNQSIIDRVKHYDWTKVDDVKLKKMSIQYDGVKNFRCHAENLQQKSFEIAYPTDNPPYVEPDVCDLANTSNKSTLDDYST